MRVTLYSEKTVAQCLSALNERMHQKESSTRPAVDGWIEKSGTFSLGLSSPVAGRFSRSTALSGKLERQNGCTVIHGSVSGGASPKDRLIIFGALALIAIVLALRGSVTLALVVVPVAAMLYIPLAGDYQNSETLIGELQKTLKARATPPKPAKKPADAQPTVRRSTPARVVASEADEPDD